MAQSKTFGRLLRMAVNGIAAYEGKNAPALEDELGQQIGLSAAAIQRYKAGHLPPEPRTIQILAGAAVQRGHLDRAWLAEFLEAAGHPAPRSISDELFPPPPALPVPAPGPLAPADRNRARMLEKVHSFWIKGVLDQSLHGAVLLELGLVDQPAAVERPWDAVLQQPARPPRPLPPGTSVHAVFEELGGALLILGAPGAGKTTMLLELTRDLLARARADAGAPMPVVFNLSTWSERHARLAGWLVEELQLRYQVPQHIARAWVEEARVVPLLDGLDEVARERREACVAAINRYHDEHGLHGLAVASRVGDYELLATRLRLHGAVLIQPLSQAQIERYLDAAGPPLAGLHQSLRGDPALRELAETPLMLSIMSLAYQGAPDTPRDLQRSPEERRRQVFALYVERMFTRRATSTAYAPAQVRRWLGWLALRMRRQGLSVFAIEGLQPAWLPGPGARLGFGVLTGALMGLVSFLLIMVGMAAMISGSGLLSGSASVGSGVDDRLAAMGLFGVVLLIGGLATGVAAHGRPAVRAALALGASGLALVLAALMSWATGNEAGLLWPAVGLGSATLGAAVGLVGGLARRARGRDDGEATIQVVETLHWSPRRALGGLAEGLLAGQAMGAVAMLTIYPTGVPELTALARLIPPLAGGLALGLLAGLLAGIVGGEVERRTTPNQGVGESARHTMRAILAGPLVALALGPILGGGALLVALVASPDSLFYDLSDSAGSLRSALLPLGLLMLISAPLLGAMIGLASGGVACLQHAVLRVMLWRGGAIPWDYARFLDYAAERLFLRKVGGSYIFIHRLLLEYIAETDGALWAERLAPADSGRPTIRLAGRPALPAPPAGALRRGWARHDAAPERPLRRRVTGAASLITTVSLASAALALAVVCYRPDASLVRTLDGPSPIRAVAFADGGSAVVAVTGGDQILQRWPVEAGRPAQTIGAVEDDPYSWGLSVSPDGATYASYQGSSMVELRRGSDGALLHTVEGSLATFAPDGRTLATVLGRDQVRLWDIASGAELARRALEGGYGSIISVAFGPDSGTLAIVGADNRVWLWRVGERGPLRTIAVATEQRPEPAGDRRGYRFPWVAHASAVALAPDGATLAVALSDGRIELRRVADGQLVALLDGHSDYVHTLAFAPDGGLLASGSRDRTVRLWRAAGGEAVATLRGHLASVMSLGFAADGRMLASGSSDHTVRLWRVGGQQ